MYVHFDELASVQDVSHPHSMSAGIGSSHPHPRDPAKEKRLQIMDGWTDG